MRSYCVGKADDIASTERGAISARYLPHQTEP